jgi:hypothetical protein
VSGQRGPVEPGRPPGTELPMDADLALSIVANAMEPIGEPDDTENARALAALRGVVQTARAYVKGRSVGRFVALCQALQEPTDRPRKTDLTEAEVDRFLAERDQLRITRELAAQLGVWAPGPDRLGGR